MATTKEKYVRMCSITVCILTVLAICIVIPVSFKNVDYDEVGLGYDMLTNVLDKEILKEGTHFRWPTGSIIRFKRIVLTLSMTGENSLPCLTSDGIEVNMGVTVNWQIRQDDIVQIVEEFGDQDGIENYTQSLSRNVIRDVCAEFPAQQLYFDRAGIQSQMLSQLQAGFEKGGAHSDVVLVQLLSVALPESLGSAIRQTQIAIQDTKQAMKQRQASLIQVQTELFSSEKENEILLIQAHANAQAIKSRSEQQIQQLRQQFDEISAAMVAMSQSLNLSGADFLDGFYKIHSMSKIPTLINLPSMLPDPQPNAEHGGGGGD